MFSCAFPRRRRLVMFERRGLRRLRGHVDISRPRRLAAMRAVSNDGQIDTTPFQPLHASLMIF